MTDSAQIRRSPKLRRIFLSLRQVRLEPPRDRSESLAHLAGMSETSHAYPGLVPVLTTSELAAHLGVPVQTIHDLGAELLDFIERTVLRRYCAPRPQRSFSRPCCSPCCGKKA